MPQQNNNGLSLELSENKTLLTETTKIWLGIIEKMAHSLVNQLTPLATKHDFLQQIMPILLKAYQLSVTHKLMEAEIEPYLLDGMDTITNIAAHADPMFKLLKAMCLFCEILLPNKTTELLSAKACVTQVLGAYPFKNNARELVHTQMDNDFTFHFPKIFLESALIQLLDVALNQCGELKQKQINLYFGKQENYHTIHFTIISKAIDALTYTDEIFSDNYFTVQANKIMPGIAFFRLAALLRDGNITYQLNKGKSLEFTIFFCSSGP